VIDSAVTEPGCAGHAMLVYRTPGEHAEVCAEYIGAGVALQAAVLVAGTDGHAGLLRSRLGERAAHVEVTRLSGPATDPGRVLSALRLFAQEHAGGQARLVQDVGWRDRPGEELAEAIRYEGPLSQAFAGSAVSVLCTYDAGLPAATLAAAERAHAAVLDGDWRLGAGYGGGGQLQSPLAGVMSKPPEDAHALTFRRDQIAVRRFAQDLGRRAGLSRDRVTDLVIAVGELAANTLRHTAGMGRLTMWMAGGELICQVSDEGHITDPLVGTIRPDPTATGTHRGLWLVHQVGDLVQLRSGPSGTTVRVHFRCPG
jgi:anti-sigma regulatory factor (Ser/Thr protein kinase)